ncbi:hypothetical protein N7453_004118 [Penicillium expansum]|nr:hypothetical protein N7453_004118 [Penicillium expansum]
MGSDYIYAYHPRVLATIQKQSKEELTAILPPPLCCLRIKALIFHVGASVCNIYPKSPATNPDQHK